MNNYKSKYLKYKKKYLDLKNMSGGSASSIMHDDINALNKYGETALIRACIMGDEGHVKLLLEHGANMDMRNKKGETALMHACRNNKIDVVKLLLEQGANMETRDVNGETALIYAYKYGRENIVKLLLEQGANIEALDVNGETALMYACKYNSENIVKLLLKHGANMETRDYYGNTALMHACMNNKIDVVKLLLEQGANMDARNESGNTALIHACNNNNKVIVRLLVEKGAIVDTQNSCKIDKMFENDIIWMSHGNQDTYKKWYLFPFKSITFYVPNDTFLGIGNDLKILNNCCRNINYNRWIKMPVLDVLNKKYNYINYSKKKLDELWVILQSEIETNPILADYVDELGVDNADLLNNVKVEKIIQIKNYLKDERKKQQIKDLFCLDKQTQLIQLRNMQLGTTKNTFNNIYGIWECTDNFKSTPRLLRNIKEDENMKLPRSIDLANAFQIIEDTLIENGIEPSQSNIKMLCCRINKSTPNIPKEIIYKAVIKDGMREGTTQNGIKWKAITYNENNFTPQTYIKPTKALNTELIPVSEDTLGLYLSNKIDITSLNDLEEGETKDVCKSFDKQPIKCDESNTFRKQSIFFHPDKNQTCKKSASKKWDTLMKLCPNTDLTNNTDLTEFRLLKDR